MSVDPVLVQNTAAWLKQAAKDIERAERCLKHEPADTEDAAFHCQQACEKALKAYLTWNDQPFRRTHDLAALGLQCKELEPGFAAWVMELDELTGYAWVYRYPTQVEPPTLAEAARSLDLARLALRRILAALPEEARRPLKTASGE